MLRLKEDDGFFSAGEIDPSSMSKAPLAQGPRETAKESGMAHM